MPDPPDIARYSFLPWARVGVAGGIAVPDNLADGPSGQRERAEIVLDVFINSTSVQKRIKLVGPGDVTGLDRRAIVRVHPFNLVTDFEPNYLPFVDFYDEDLPWRYTPAAPAGQRLRPWLALVVLDEDAGEFERATVADARLPAITVAEPGRVLPPPGELWAWAHVHVNDDLEPGADDDAGAHQRLREALARDPDVAGSRLLSPRRLGPNRPYRAFLVPVFEAGRLTGLGQDIPANADGLAPAWGSNPVTLPVYFSWRFRTGEQGDFEHLVGLLQPRALDPRIGIRDMDVQEPGFGLPSAGQPVLGLEGAMRTPDTASTVWTDPAAFQQRLTELINLADDLTQPGNGDSAPTVTMPLYGRWHGRAARVGEADTPAWIQQVNLDPRNRAAAGLGTRVVQAFQERYMHDAWEQIGEVLAANTLLNRIRLAQFANSLLHRRDLSRLPLGSLLAVTAPVHAGVLGSPTTIQHQLGRSQLARAAVDPALRRALRPGGPLRRRLEPDAARQPHRLIERLDSGELSAAPPKRAGEGQNHLDRFLPDVLRGGAARPEFEDRLTRAAVERIPRRPGYRVSRAGLPVPDLEPGDQDSDEAGRFRLAAVGLHGLFETTVPTPPARGPLGLEAARAALLEALHPDQALSRRIRRLIDLRGRLPGGPVRRPDTLDRILAAPDLPYPMYAELGRVSEELLLPNVGLIERNTISLLVTNQPFIEAYMLGLNHEMARELLWREYPTDQRGSYFRQFWDVADTAPAGNGLGPSDAEARLRDILPIHEWSRDSDLGEHDNRPTSAPRLVLVIRGDLLNRYPTAVITAAPAAWPQGATQHVDRRVLYDQEIEPDFTARIGEDITFLGFDLTVTQARGTRVPSDGKPGWFFVIKERPGEPRFGLDLATAPATTTATSWDDLSWGHLGTPERFDEIEHISFADGLHHVAISPAKNPDKVQWGTQAADVAHILYQVPVLVAVHADRMLANI